MNPFRLIVVVLMAAAVGRGPTPPAGYQTGHIRDILFVGWSPDSSIVVSYSGADETVRFWEPLTGRLIGWRSVATEPAPVEIRPGLTLRITRPESYTIDIADLQTAQTLWHYHASGTVLQALSPDGRLMANTGKLGGNVVRISDAKTGRLVQKLEGHPGVIRGLSFSSDGKLLASADGDGVIRIRDVNTGHVQFTLEGHDGPVVAVAISPDGTLLASSGEDETLRIWDLASKTEKFKLIGHRWEVQALAFSSDSLRLASGGGDGDRTVKLWDLRTGQLLFSADVPGWRGKRGYIAYCCGSAVSMLRFSPSGRTVAVGCDDGYAYLLDAASHRMQQIAKGKGPHFHAVHFDDDTHWEWLIGGEVVTQYRHPGDTRELMSTDFVTALTSGTRGEFLVTGTADGDLRVFRTRNGDRLIAWIGQFEVDAVALSPDDRFVSAGGLDQNLRLFNVQSGELIWSAENLK